MKAPRGFIPATNCGVPGAPENRLSFAELGVEAAEPGLTFGEQQQSLSSAQGGKPGGEGDQESPAWGKTIPSLAQTSFPCPSPAAQTSTSSGLDGFSRILTNPLLPLRGDPAAPSPEFPELSRERIFHQGKASLQRCRALPGGGGEALESRARSWLGIHPGEGREEGPGRCRGEQGGEPRPHPTPPVSLPRMRPRHKSSPGRCWGIKGSFYHLPGSKYFQFATLIDVNKVMLNSEIWSRSASERRPGPPR